MSVPGAVHQIPLSREVGIMTLSPDFEAEARLDLWIHQNQLIWSRLQWFAISQVTMVSAAYTLSQWLITIGLGLVTMIATLALMHITNVDRVIRNKYRDELKMYGISVGIDPQQSTADSKRYEAGSLSWLKPLTSHFYLTGIFLFAIAFDVIAFTYLASLQLNN
jgi:hypothetical protein